MKQCAITNLLGKKIMRFEAGKEKMMMVKKKLQELTGVPMDAMRLYGETSEREVLGHDKANEGLVLQVTTYEKTCDKMTAHQNHGKKYQLHYEQFEEMGTKRVMGVAHISCYGRRHVKAVMVNDEVQGHQYFEFVCTQDDKIFMLVAGFGAMTDAWKPLDDIQWSMEPDTFFHAEAGELCSSGNVIFNPVRGRVLPGEQEECVGKGVWARRLSYTQSTLGRIS